MTAWAITPHGIVPATPEEYVASLHRDVSWRLAMPCAELVPCDDEPNAWRPCDAASTTIYDRRQVCASHAADLRAHADTLAAERADAAAFTDALRLAAGVTP